MKRALAVIALLAGCELPPLTLRFRITQDDSQLCPGDTGNTATSCSDITMICPAVVSIRVVPPNDPTVPYISVCKPLLGAQDTLCSIAGIDLPEPTVPIPEQVLEVQMAVFPRSAVGVDPITGDLVCPHVDFAANGLPIQSLPVCSEQDPTSCPRMPAVGGRTYYHPGDEETVVELGCSDLSQLQDQLTCEGIKRIAVTATVNDFDDFVASVDKSLASSLTVDVGEPKPQGIAYVLPPASTRELIPSTDASSPAWSVELTDLGFEHYVCLQVLEDGAQATSALTCRADDDSDMIDMAGVYLSKDTLNQILDALALSEFPDEGLVVGLVLDQFFDPLPNVAVSCNGCTVKYLNANRDGIVPGATSASGIFVSDDAAFGTGFAIPSTALRPVLGGLVERKVTIVVIQDKIPIGP
jgi:hypothetical protein